MKTVKKGVNTPQLIDGFAKPEKSVVEGWELLEPDTYFETKKIDVFNHFLNSKGTNEISASLEVDKFTIMIRGESSEGKASVYFSLPFTNISRPAKIEMVEAINALPGLSGISKGRWVPTLASYFGVSKELKL